MWRDVPKDRETMERWKRFPAIESGILGLDRYALTFDDGPDRDATPAVLDALSASNATATFFMVGEQVERWPDITRDVANRGHEIACHGFDHTGHPERPDEEVRDDIRRAVDAIESATSIRPRLFRPPYGRFSKISCAACDELDMERIYWSAWGADWDPVDGETIAKTVLGDLKDGSIVLLHDSPSYASRKSARPTAEAIASIVATARAGGLSGVTVSRLLSEPDQ